MAAAHCATKRSLRRAAAVFALGLAVVSAAGCGGGGSSTESSSPSSEFTGKGAAEFRKCVNVEWELLVLEARRIRSGNRMAEHFGDGKTQAVPSDPKGEAEDECARYQRVKEGNPTPADERREEAGEERVANYCGPPGTPGKVKACQYYWETLETPDEGSSGESKAEETERLKAEIQTTEEEVCETPQKTVEAYAKGRLDDPTVRRVVETYDRTCNGTIPLK